MYTVGTKKVVPKNFQLCLLVHMCALNLVANLFQISQSFDWLVVCTHVHFKHKKIWALKFDDRHLNSHWSKFYFHMNLILREKFSTLFACSHVCTKIWLLICFRSLKAWTDKCFCMHVRCTHKKTYAPKFENSISYTCTHLSNKIWLPICLGSLKALTEFWFLPIYAVRTRKFMPQNLKIQFCMNVCRYEQKSGCQSVWDLLSEGSWQFWRSGNVGFDVPM